MWPREQSAATRPREQVRQATAPDALGPPALAWTGGAYVAVWPEAGGGTIAFVGCVLGADQRCPPGSESTAPGDVTVSPAEAGAPGGGVATDDVRARYIVIILLDIYHKRDTIIHMRPEVRSYLAEIGRRGGRRSRRVLPPETARRMVRLREARRAFKRFYARCFWSSPKNYVVTMEDIPWVARQLMTHGGRDGWRTGASLCR